MADDSLITPVIIQATRIDATLLPRNIFSQPYTLYVIQQGTDLGNVAGKANEAGQGAWDAQVKNDEQDLVLADHEVRIEAAEQTLINHEQRITAAEATLVNHEARITANEAELANHEIRITQNTTDIAALTVRMVSAESAITSLQTNVATLTTRVTTAEGNITTLQANLGALTTRVTTAEGNITSLQSAVTAIQGDYVSKTATTNQIVQAGGGSLIVGSVAPPTTDKLQVGGSINVSVSYKVAGTQVLSARQTGWTAATGTAYKGAFDANQAWTIGILNVLQIQQIADSLTQARQRIKALEDMARTHGMIN
ncbi:phage tail protein [Serratia quinivorans]|uniref:phage tail protein n=1 Tax=Serratia quinivorans TaxID=137545 RepID=UPI003F6ED8E0